MTPKRRLFIGALLVLSGAVGYVAGRALFRPVPTVTQPVAFDHARHTVELELECSMCHELYETSRHAGLPSLEICAACHDEADPDLPRAAVIPALLEAGEMQVFRKLFRLEDHVYYSHRRHVVLAGLECETCHGAIAASTTPPEAPLRRITMDFCMDCHERENVRADCTSCHR